MKPISILLKTNKTLKFTTERLRELRTRRLIKYYLKSGRKPWSKGYYLYRSNYISGVLNDQNLMKAFMTSNELPEGFGFALDERVVEYPWVLSRLSSSKKQLLDAGSSLNHEPILDYAKLSGKQITILCLAPERKCFWNRGISYLYHDIRDIPIRDDYFDEVICLSTLEHVGMNNTKLYTEAKQYHEENPRDYLVAVLELIRVLKKGGRLFITVPYGQYETFGWFQQINSELLGNLLKMLKMYKSATTFYNYTDRGWKLSDQSSCSDAKYFDIRCTKYFDPKSSIDFDSDLAAAARAVVCIEVEK